MIQLTFKNKKKKTLVSLLLFVLEIKKYISYMNVDSNVNNLDKLGIWKCRNGYVNAPL